jgi:hypothetical protein
VQGACEATTKKVEKQARKSLQPFGGLKYYQRMDTLSVIAYLFCFVVWCLFAGFVYGAAVKDQKESFALFLICFLGWPVLLPMGIGARFAARWFR